MDCGLGMDLKKFLNSLLETVRKVWIRKSSILMFQNVKETEKF